MIGKFRERWDEIKALLTNNAAALGVPPGNIQYGIVPDNPNEKITLSAPGISVFMAPVYDEKDEAGTESALAMCAILVAGDAKKATFYEAQCSTQELSGRIMTVLQTELENETLRHVWLPESPIKLFSANSNLCIQLISILINYNPFEELIGG